MGSRGVMALSDWAIQSYHIRTACPDLDEEERSRETRIVGSLQAWLSRPLDGRAHSSQVMTSFSRFESERLGLAISMGSIQFKGDAYLERLRDTPLSKPACSSVGMYGSPIAFHTQEPSFTTANPSASPFDISNPCIRILREAMCRPEHMVVFDDIHRTQSTF